MTSEPDLPRPDPPRPRFQRIGRVLTSSAVRQQIEESIVNGTYGPGSALPSERALAEELQVSRVAVREALSSLKAVGLVTIEHGRGTFVAGSPGAVYVDTFKAWIALHRDEVIELMQIRGALDALAAATAASCATKVDLREVRSAERAFAKAVTEQANAEYLSDLDVQFHMQIVAAGRSAMQYHLLGELHKQLHRSRHALLSQPARARQSTIEHREIVKCIISGDVDSAERAMREHVQSSLRSVKEIASNH